MALNNKKKTLAKMFLEYSTEMNKTFHKQLEF